MASHIHRLSIFLVSLLLIAGVLYIKSLFNPHSALIPFPQPILELTDDQRIDSPPNEKKRVAIIGAGASGSAAAFYLERAAREAGLNEDDLEIEIYEKEGYVGGRSTIVHPYEDLTLPPIELGASIFVSVNRILMRAVSHFNLTLTPWSSSTSEDEIGIWDGSVFLLITQGGVGWWDKAKLLWRYGYWGPKRTLKAVSELTQTIMGVYDSIWVKVNAPWKDVESLNEALEFDSMTGQTARRYLVNGLKTGTKWADEMVEASTRVNYAQDITDLHGLVGMVSMATSGATSILGGNRQIFESFVHASGAQLNLGKEVNSIKAQPDNLRKWHIGTKSSSLSSTTFDAIIFAAPWHLSYPFALDADPVVQRIDAGIPKQSYIHLYVTLLTTTSPHPLPGFFGMAADSKVPTTVLTSAVTSREEGSQRPDFQSITYHGKITEDSDEWVVKIFSMERRSDEWLERVFGEGQVRWVLRKEWDSYPKMPPTDTFPPIFPLGRNSTFLYLAAQEPWISTMETQALSGRNAAALLAEDWWGVSPGTCPGVVEGGWDWTC